MDWTSWSSAERGAARRSVVMVVDDSITTRTLEKNILETAGYDVRVAADGLEAWTALQTEAVDLIVSDVDMPRLNGFELTEKVRADEEAAVSNAVTDFLQNDLRAEAAPDKNARNKRVTV